MVGVIEYFTNPMNEKETDTKVEASLEGNPLMDDERSNHLGDP